MAFDNSIVEVFEFSGTAGGDYGDIDGIGDGFVELVIVAFLCAIGVHTGQEYFTCTELFGFCGPFDDIETRWFRAGFYTDVPAAGALL